MMGNGSNGSKTAFTFTTLPVDSGRAWAHPASRFRVHHASGNPTKFRHGIYLIYTWYILSSILNLVYTRYMTGICFFEKKVYLCTIECMYACDDYFPSIQFIVHWTGTFLVKVTLGWIYKWYMTGIYLVYTWYIPRLFLISFWVSKCIEIRYKTITTT